MEQILLILLTWLVWSIDGHTAHESSNMSSSESKSTVDAGEASFWSKGSIYNWDEDINLKKINTVRVPFIRDALSKTVINTNAKVSADRTVNIDGETLKGLKILDVGCGAGYLSEALARLGADVTGIDIVQVAIESAINHAAKDETTKKIRYNVSTIEDHSQNHKDFYDAVVASEVVEHVNDPEFFVESCVSVLKPGGSIFFTSPGKTISSWLHLIFLAEYVFGVIPLGTHTYDKFVAPDKLQRMLEKNDCTTMQLIGITNNCLTKTWSLSADTRVHYGLHAVKNR